MLAIGNATRKLNSRGKNYIKYALLIVSLVLILAIGRSTLRLLGRGDAIKEAEKRVEELREEQAKLLQMKERVETKEFIEEQAREKLGLAKEGEVVVVLPSEEVLRKFAPEIEEEEFAEKLPIWRRWKRMFF